MKHFKILIFILSFTLFVNTILQAQSMESILFVTIETEPSDAELVINGKIIDRTKQIELTAGKHELILNHAGYYRLSETIKVSRKSAYFSFTLVKDPNAIIIPVEKVEEPIVETIVKSEEIAPQNKPVNLDIEMVLVPGGKFLMGKSGRDADKKLHGVKVSDFQIGKYEITQQQWEAVMGNNPSKFQGDAQMPVESVSFDDVLLFISKLNKITGNTYRLPTEAEWEYAARGGDSDDLTDQPNIDDIAWYWINSGDTLLSGNWDNEKIKLNNGRTHGVGQKLPNKFGLYDMSGNVWEWCSDWYDKEYYKISPLENPQGPETGVARVYRGGSWVSSEDYCHPTFRFSGNPAYGLSFVGFRVVLVP